MKVPYLDLRAQMDPLRAEFVAAFNKTLDANSFILGPDVAAFEKDFAAYRGAAHAIGLSSGTAALHIALRCLDVGPGDEVVTGPMTFAATCWAISYVGAKPVFVDVREDSCTLDPEKLERAITPRTKAVIPVHLYGQPFDLDPIREICARKGVALIEDAAQCHGAEYKGRRIGSPGGGVCACFSFYPGKNLGAIGEGGALTTNDEAFAKRARALRDHASTVRYYHDEVGFNYRMDGLQGAILGIKLKRLDGWNAGRRAAAARYQSALAGLPLRLPFAAADRTHVWHIYSVRTPRRDELKAHLEAQGIGCGLHYPVPMHLQKSYAELGHREGDFPVSEAIGRECLSLPMFAELTAEQQIYVTDAIKAFFKA